MIGGIDIVIPAVGDSAELEACVRIILHHWPHARFEDAESSEKYAQYGDISFDRVRELFVYSDAHAEATWDAGREDSPPNSMLYLIRSPDFLTVVVDDPNTAGMQTMLEEIRTILRESSSNNGSVEKDKRLIK